MADEREDQEIRESYHKVDRRIGRESEAEGQPSPQAPRLEPDTSSEAPEEDSFHHEEAGAEVEIDVYGILRMCLGMFAEQAWVQLGLQLAPGKSELKQDLKQARLAIDTVDYIVKALGDNLNAQEQREVEQLLATLRMNFVQRS